MSELEEVSFWPGSSDGSYSRVGPTAYKVVTCRRRNVLILAAVIAVLFIIGVAIPAGMFEQYKKSHGEVETTAAASKHSTSSPKSTSTKPPSTPAPTVAPTPDPDAPKWGVYRLPRTVAVSEYSIALSVNPASKGPIPYSGTVNMLLNIVEDTNLIVLHAADMNITKVEVGVAIEGTFADVTTYKMYKEFEQLEVSLEKNYTAGMNLNLKVTFNTVLRKDLRGLYQSITSDETSILTTQFEPTYARLAFPCFDEPDFKAKFKLDITKPKSYHSLFNSPLNTTASVEGDETMDTDSYGFSPVMSTYLVAIIVSKLESTDPLIINSTTNEHPIKITVYGQAGTVSQLEYARDVTSEIIKTYEELFQVSYPLSKLDIVAIPDFEAGAMENWGLITFAESSLLFDPKTSDTAQKKWVTLVVAHELAHQWFGNYVTMKWWNELWLNEGFASFAERLIGTKAISDKNNYGWNVEDDFLQSVTKASHADSLHNSHALSQSPDAVQSNSVIMYMFDSISYTKGSAILHMLDGFVTRNVTKAALYDYLSSYNYSNAEASDLWASYDKAYKAANENADNSSISTMMDSWTRLSGLPVILVDIAEDKVKVTQEPFFLCKDCNITDEENNRTWVIPIQYKYDDGSEMKNGSYMLKDKQGEIDTPGIKDWIKLNAGWTGFYLVNYTGLSKMDLKSLDNTDTAELLESTLELFRAGYVSSEGFMKLLDKLMKGPEPGYLTTRMMLKSWQFILDIFDQSYEDYGNVSPIAYKWLNVTDMDVSYEALTTMDVNARSLLVTKLSMALSIDHDQVLKDNPEFNNLTIVWREALEDTGNITGIIHKDINRLVGQCAFQSDETGLWGPLWVKYTGTKIASEHEDIERILTSAKDVLILLRLLDYSLDETKIKKDEALRVIRDITTQRNGRAIGWDFIRSNWAALFKNHKTMISRLVLAATSMFSDERRLLEMDEFFAKNKVGAEERPVKQAREIVMTNIYFMSHNSQSLLTEILREIPDA